MEQRSPEWRKARLGIPTASSFDKIITPSGAPSGQAQSYMCRLIGERLLGRSLEEDISGVKWVRHGNEFEREAAAMLEATINERLKPVGFVASRCGRWGASPDRLVLGKSIAVEIKCPSPWKHIEYTLYGPHAVKKDYKCQVQGQMLVGGYDLVYFFSYFPGMPSRVWRYERDDKFIELMRKALTLFSDNLEKATKDYELFGRTYYETALEILSKLMPEET